MFRFARLGLLWCVSCGPDIESTSETLDGGGSGTDDPTCGGETPPGVLAFVDVVERMESAVFEIDVEIDGVRQELAAALGLPMDAEVEAVAVAIEAAYAAYAGPGSTMQVGEVRCTGGIDAARETLAICGPGQDPSAIGFTCEGECTIAAPQDCAAPRCRGTLTACDGECTGACELAVGGACDGRCDGTCEGTCACIVGETLCAGACDGMCTGTCTLVEGACDGTCTGTCDGADAPTCDGVWTCEDAGTVCTIDCSGWAEPIDAPQGCTEVAAATSAISASCALPPVTLHYTSTMCSEFATTAITLEAAAPRLHRAAARLSALRDRAKPVVEPLLTSLFDQVDLSDCTAQVLLDSSTRFGSVVAAAGTTAIDVMRLEDALDPA